MAKFKEITITEVEAGVLAVEGSPLRIYYNTADEHGAPAELWQDSQHLSTWAKLNVAKDMAKKKYNEIEGRRRNQERRKRNQQA